MSDGGVSRSPPAAPTRSDYPARPSQPWPATVAELGRPGLHFHDLRHTGNTLAAATETSLRDLMARMGHDQPGRRADLPARHERGGSGDREGTGRDDDKVAGDDDQGDDDPADGAAGAVARAS
ncbi:hypothetical protein GCM10009835_20930 [Planosporangium flavigriseum]|uniref:Phage integrase family protein n=1 Tax=Planosporangium flavigriseum TaxID=373681 RepID=A0A8J3PJB3_9ACTN|nr:hypothetical protein Pfl04_05250 [Planosporangium flavigriseum]